VLSFFLLAVETANKIARSTAEVFTDLYREFLPKVYRYVSYRISDTHMAEDLTSLIFEKALTKFRSYSSEKAAFSTWIFSIARNTVIDHFRASGKTQVVQIENISMTHSDGPSPEEEMIRSEEYKMLQSCISQLGQQEQEIISLKFGAEMTNRQIARMTGLSESNVGIIIYRTVRKLRDNFNRGWVHG
jgi:RNA polymerase sigma factor (sigma-70 family)